LFLRFFMKLLICIYLLCDTTVYWVLLCLSRCPCIGTNTVVLNTRTNHK
jgi:hypothetical protein